MIEITNELWNESLTQAKVQSEPIIKEALAQSGLPTNVWDFAMPLIDWINSIIGGLI